MSSTGPSRVGRTKKATKVYQCPNEKERWTFEEKRSLLEAVQRHGSDDASVLQPYVPSRSCKEIEWLILGIKVNRDLVLKRKTISPIDKWANLVDDLVEGEEKDFSAVLAQIMAVVAHSEYTDKPLGDGQEGGVLNYSRLYQYLAALLSNKPAVVLSPLESAIMLDLMYGLATKLRESDLTSAKALMLWKYQLLTAPVVPGQKEEITETIRKALENDILTMTIEKKTKSTSKSASPDKADNSSKVMIVSPAKSSERGCQTSEEDIESESVLVSGVGTQTEEESESESYPSQKKSDRKRKSSTSESTENSPTKKSPSTQACTEVSNKKSNFPEECVLVDEELPPLPSTVSVADSVDEEDNNQPSKKSKSTKPLVREFKKPTLYTLNPLCIPVSLLNLKPKVKKRKKKTSSKGKVVKLECDNS